ncbi:MAG: HD domain-containing protein [Chloroflexales bacterium]|nr:HD domain-containing protein [Chloroflexales bacterium]
MLEAEERMVDQPDFAAAQQYALGRLERELDPRLRYHSLAHTRDDVLPAVERLAALGRLYGEDLLLLRTAALFHDLGFLVSRASHEAQGVAIAAALLPTFGYRPAQVEQIGAMIRATRLPQSPQSLLEQILADADLDLLGRTDFLERNRMLREELRAFGDDTTDEAWYDGQIKFMTQHRYWTPAARALREPQKARNIEVLRALLAARRLL